MRLRELLQKTVDYSTHQHNKSTAGSLAMDRLRYAFDHANA